MSPRPGERTVTVLDPLAEALGSLPSNMAGMHVLKIDHLFGSRPDVLESVKAAKARGVSAGAIADALSRDGTPVSSSAVENWLKVQRSKLTAATK